VLENAETLLGTSIPSYGLLFQALATNSNVNVLSSPHILTTDNEEAEISVGENIPYQSSLSGYPGSSGTSGSTTGFGFPVQSIQREDVALTLKITPHINASDMVRLEIDQEISDIADPNFQGFGPSWSKRTLKTTVVVKDQQSIVIGGLISDKRTYSESKVPLLGDIPLLGYLFKYTKKSKSKTNLLVLLTPYVIKDQMDIEDIVQRKSRERAEFSRSFATFSRLDYRPDIDYRRKRGLVEEINHVVRMVEEEAKILEELNRKADEYPDGPIDFGDADPGPGADDEAPADGDPTPAADGPPAEPAEGE
jgi:general secretion pathway protein D